MMMMMMRKLSCCMQASALLSLLTAAASFTPDPSSSLRSFDGSLHVSATTSQQGANFPFHSPWTPPQPHQRPRRNINDSSSSSRRPQQQSENISCSASSSSSALRSPVVDSTLLRFVHSQREQLTRAKSSSSPQQQQQQAPLKQHQWLHSASTVNSSNSTTTSLLYNAAATATAVTTTRVTDAATVSSAPENAASIDEAQAEAALLDLDTINNVAAVTNAALLDTAFTNTVGDLWLAQFNRNRVAALLLQLDPTLDETVANQAGEAVQAEALARTARRRLRTFLKERDEQWHTNAAANTATQQQTTISTSETSTSANNHQFISSTSTSFSASTLTATEHSPSIQDSLDVLLQSGLTVGDVAAILQHSPGIALMRATGANEQGETLSQTLERVWTLLTTTLPLRRYDARKIIRSTPGLLTLRGSQAAYSVIGLLQKLNVSTTSIVREKHALTTLLLRAPDALFRLVAFLSSDAVRMPLDSIGPLLRRSQSQQLLDHVVPAWRLSTPSYNHHDDDASSIDGNDTADFKKFSSFNFDSLDSVVIEAALWKDSNQVRRDRVNDLYKRMSKTAWTLRHEIGTADLGKVISAYPSVLLLDAETQILPTAKYLMEELGIFEDDLPKVLQLYPTLLGIPINSMKRIVSYLRDDLGVEEENLPSIFRSFPALLTTEIKDMEKVVAFLRDQVGIRNIGRFVTRIPPVLGYSVEQELLPKWQFLQTVCMDTRLEISKFPAVFSYPFERVLKTRYEYLQYKGRTPIHLFPLDEVVRHGDKEFATKVANDEDDGVAFAAFCQERIAKNSPQRRPRKGKAKKQDVINSM